MRWHSDASVAPRSRSTRSITSCVMLPVITVVGMRSLNASRAAAFCTPIAAAPSMPTPTTHGALASAGGSACSPQSMQLASRAICSASSRCRRGPPLRSTPRASKRRHRNRRDECRDGRQLEQHPVRRLRQLAADENDVDGHVRREQTE